MALSNRTRKTVDVQIVRDRANRALAHAPALIAQEQQHGEDGARAYRQGVAAVIEDILLATGNYHGFQYMDGQKGRRDDTIRRYN